ncbi:MAG: hypothetical protein H7Y38_20260 [Armatimonadetes bacterium]|nr:hypothetical protein [Armatimonadota bacterium]
MPQHFPNPFPVPHPATALYESLTTYRTGDAPLLPKAVYNAELTAAITDLHTTESIPSNVAALLHLLNDDLDAAHVLCQADESDPTANYIHQIVHRREGDFGNTRYWIAKTGAHPFYAHLATLTQTVGASAWNPGDMVTWATRGEGFAARLSDAETQGLLGWCVVNDDDAARVY